MMDPRALAEAAEEVARGAGDIVAAGSLGARRESHKGHAHNLVTEIDEASERYIVDWLRRRFPSHAIVAEEGGGAEGGEAAGGEAELPITWFVDPLDGTNNYAHGFPMFAVSLAATRGDDVLAGVTYDPLRGEMFVAVAGEGARLNGVPLAVSLRDRLEASLVATGFPYDKASNPDNNLAEFVAVTPKVRGVRRTGSACLDLAYVAAGRLDAYWERGTQAWDVATGILLVREAGGTVTDLDGRAPRLNGARFVASNGRIHAELVDVLSEVRRDRAWTANNRHSG